MASFFLNSGKNLANHLTLRAGQKRLIGSVGRHCRRCRRSKSQALLQTRQPSLTAPYEETILGTDKAKNKNTHNSLNVKLSMSCSENYVQRPNVIKRVTT